MTEVEWIRLSTLEHYAYCPRQAYLLLDGVWADNHFTVSGTSAHARVDEAGTDHRRGVKVHHRVEIAHPDLRIYGIADSVEESTDGSLMPVEHKLGRGAGDLRPALMQVTAQAMCVEAMTGRSVPRAAVYLVGERRREYVETSEYSAAVLDLVQHARADLAMFVPAVFEARVCKSCSIQNACQPSGCDWA